MRGLKILVVVMGILLVAGLAVLVAAVAGRISRSGPALSPSRPFAAGAIDIPRGARIEAMTAGADRLIVGLALPQGDRQLMVIDLATGTRLGAIDLHVSP